LATVTWGAQFEKTGDRILEFEISYLLEKSGEEWRILAYISRSDQAAEMAKERLLTGAHEHETKEYDLPLVQ
jgi:hypothetical protein